MPTPRSGESESDFVSRCIPIVIEEGTAADGSQANAICHSMYQNKENEKMGKILDIHDDIQEDNPTRLQGVHTTGQPLGYDKPEGVLSGQEEEITVPEGQRTPRSDDQDLDELFPVK